MVALSIVGIMIAAVLFDFAVQRGLRAWRAHKRRARRMEYANATLPEAPLDVRMAPGVFHHRSQTWLHWHTDGKATVGTNDLLHRIVGHIDEIRLPQEGQRLRRGEKTVMVRQGDRVLYLPSPASGDVVEVNKELLKNPNMIKEDPFGTGWLFSMTPVGAEADLAHLMISQRAGDWTRREIERMRAFFDELLQHGDFPAVAAAGLEGILEKLDDHAWVLYKDQFIYEQEWRS